MRALYPHQAAAMQYARGRHAIALFMEMRLGKTLVAIRWARGARVLVVAPLTVLPGWVTELQEEGIPPYYIHLLYGSCAERMAIAQETVRATSPSNWYLVNYEGLRACRDLADLPWDCVICDESTRLRNPKAQITKLLTRRFGHVPQRAILSGMPAPEGPEDYFSQMQFLHGGFLGTSNFWAFRNKFFHVSTLGWDWTPNPGTVEAIKKEVHRTSFVLTRQQAGMGNKKIYERRVVPMAPEIKAAIKKLKKDWAFSTGPGQQITTKWATTQALWMARLAGGFSPDRNNPQLLSKNKIKELTDLLKGELKGQKVVVWFRFNEELHAVRNALLEAKLGPIGWVTGAIDKIERGKIAMAFGKGYFPILLMQEQVGKFGLNLSAASVAIYYSNLYEYEARAQSEDRIEHMQKSEPLLYIDLVTEHSIDEEVVDALHDKKMDAKTFMRRLTRFVAQEWRELHGQGQSPKTRPAAPSIKVRVRRRSAE